MTKSLPAIFSLSIENMKLKIDFYDSINLHESVVISPNILMQSIALSYARYYFYQDRGIVITSENFDKLFVCQKRFEKQYGISKEELLKMYDYEKYIEEKKNGRVI